MPAIKRLFTLSKSRSLNGNQHKVSWKNCAQVSKNQAGNISQLNALFKGNRCTRTALMDFFFLFVYSYLFHLEQMLPRSNGTDPLFNVRPWCWCLISPRAFFSFTASQPTSVNNKRENLAYTSLESFICVLAVFFVVIMTVLLIPRMRHGAFGPPHEVHLAAHRLEKTVVIRLVEKLHSADNPTEIAHGFPVPKVENKHTPLEYIMRVPNKSPNWSVQSPHSSFKVKQLEENINS